MVNCAYHPNDAAITNCERCRRPICAMDKRILRRQQSSGTANSQSYYSVQYEYCPICYADEQVKQMTNPVGYFVLIFGIGFIVFFIAVSTLIFSQAGPNAPSFFILFQIPFYIIPGIMLVGIVRMLLNAPKRAQNARNEKESFLQSLSQQPEGVTSKQNAEYIAKRAQPHVWSTTEIHCFQCGSTIDLKDRFCAECGDSTDDERKAFS